MSKVTPYLLICLILGASCSKTERMVTPGGNGDREMVFSARMAEDDGWKPLQTKADVSISDLKDNAGSNGWGVFAYYTGTENYTNPSEVQGVIFNKRKVWWDGSTWQYYVDTDHEKEYWPMDDADKVTFFAYGPYKDYNGDGIVTVDDEKGPLVRYTASTDLSAQKDLLWGTNTSGLPHRNVNLATYPDSVVDFHFRHAPAKIHFTINGATLGDESGLATAYGAATTNTTYGTLTISTDAAGWQVNSNGNRTVYWAYRQKTVTTTQVYRRTISGFKILLNKVEMTNFIKNGILHLNNTDAYLPYWEADGDEMLDYSFGISDMVTGITNPGNETNLSNGWGTTYLGVDNNPQELLPAPDNYIYMVTKEADTLSTGSKNITITAFYHVIGLSKTEQFTRTTTTVSWQRVPYFERNSNYRYLTGNNQNNSRSYTQLSNDVANSSGDVKWADFTDSNHPSNTTSSDGASSTVGTPTFNYSQDNDGAGFKAVGTINSDIIGGRDYTINLYLDGRELNLTVIPQQWDLQETVYGFDQTLNPIIQALTYDSGFVYDQIAENVYINNRMGKFYFKLGKGMYLYWQASLIGDDAFAFTDENGEYLKDENDDYLTSIRGDIGEAMNYIYVKATNTASQVTSRAKLRIYLFDSNNHAVVALPKLDPEWLFVNSKYNDENGDEKRVQEWTVVQPAN